MSPQEKAKDIYDKMKGFRVKNSHRKSCALKCADEVIDSLKNLDGLQDNMKVRFAIKHWQWTKEEIEKL
jgi:copper chaperone CopZ